MMLKNRESWESEKVCETFKIRKKIANHFSGYLQASTVSTISHDYQINFSKIEQQPFEYENACFLR